VCLCAGAVELGEAVVAACDKPSNFKFLYDVNLPIKVCDSLLWSSHAVVEESTPCNMLSTAIAS
jgi:hypothetical protein